MLVLPNDLLQRAAGDGYGLPRDPRGVVGGQKRHRIGDVLRRTLAPHRDGVDEIVAEGGRPVVPLPLVIRAGRHEAGRNGIHGDAERPELLGKLFDQTDLSVLGGGIALDAVRLVARPARLEMVTMRPVPFVFIAGATALMNRNAPLRLASTMASKSSALTSSRGRGLWPRTPPAT